MKYCLLGNNDKYDNNAKFLALGKCNFCAAWCMQNDLLELLHLTFYDEQIQLEK
jgi:hypothetical protein